MESAGIEPASGLSFGHQRGPLGLNAWSASDQALAAMVDLLRTDNLPVGARLPNLLTLANQLGVSHVVARDALDVLEAEEIVAVRQGRTGGIYVVGRTGFPRCLTRLYPDATRDLIPELIDARAVLERELIEQAAAHLDAEGSARLAAIVVDMEEARGDVELFVELTVRFHLRVALVAANRVLAGYMRDLLNRLAVAGITATSGALSDRTLGRATRIYVELLAALQAGDPKRITAAVDTHIDTLRRTTRTSHARH